MARPARKHAEVVEDLLKRVDKLDDDTLWKFVCRLLPEAKIDFLEDVFDSLAVVRSRHEPSKPLDAVLYDLDKRHGADR